LQISNSPEAYRRKRIGERVEPCGTPASTSNGSVSLPWILSVVVRPPNKALNPSYELPWQSFLPESIGKFETTDNELLGVKGISEDEVMAILKKVVN
jgi:hypothetical protein